MSNKHSLENDTVDELLNKYAKICVAQDHALFYDEYKTFSKLYEEMASIDRELRRRGTAARLALCRLFDHPNLQVRLQAAKESLAVASTDSLNVIKAIAESRIAPQALDAGMTLIA